MRALVLLASLAACAKSASSPPPTAPAPAPAPAPAAAPAPTEKVTDAAIDKQMIADAIAPLRESLHGCADKFPKIKGVVKVKGTVAPEGTVTVEIEKTPDAALGECVASIVRTAKFPKTIAGGTFGYPFVY